MQFLYKNKITILFMYGRLINKTKTEQPLQLLSFHIYFLRITIIYIISNTVSWISIAIKTKHITFIILQRVIIVKDLIFIWYKKKKK